MKRLFAAGASRWDSGAIVLWAVVCMFATASAHVLAQDDSTEAARSALAAGNWQEAADLGEATGTTAGWAVAVDALSIHAHYVAPEEEAEALLQRAMQLAEEAVLLDPTDPEVRFQLAHAVGRYAQYVSPLQAFAQGLVSRSRELLEDVLELDPDMVPARLQLGSWHADVIGQAGPVIARMTHSATEDSALEHYDRVLELAGDDLGVYAEVARGLLRLDRDEYRDRAQDLLSRAVALEPQDALERILHDQVVRELAELEND
ncbi:MAG: hypothetical protein F4234_03380 [Gammaproteobacteria bacterium]|nr:hypothetical protein [Gammaproteobacteria bacterium]MYC60209.1 hypothetical protein [Gammaproteobacteria bacterium]MYE99212.1 hypothetical protein [Gammaproteobacteria bacterium]